MIPFKTSTGRIKKVNPFKYRIDWEADSRSKFQTRVKQFLYQYWNTHMVCEEFPIESRLSLDFFNATTRVAVEVQGEQHFKYVKHFHNGFKNNWLNQLDRDQRTAAFCERNDIILVEIYPKDVLNKELFKRFGVKL